MDKYGARSYIPGEDDELPYVPGLWGGVERGSMMNHHRRLHDTELEIYWERIPFIQMEHLPQFF